MLGGYKIKYYLVLNDHPIKSQSSHVAQKGLGKKWHTGKDVNYTCSICIAWTHISVMHTPCTYY